MIVAWVNYGLRTCGAYIISYYIIPELRSGLLINAPLGLINKQIYYKDNQTPKIVNCYKPAWKDGVSYSLKKFAISLSD